MTEPIPTVELPESTDEEELLLREWLTVTERDYEGWKLALRLVLWFGAALADATEPQARRMRRRAGPLLDVLRETGDTSGIYRLIHEVHGVGWRPQNEYGDLLKQLEIK